jgi:hypothetical protein
MVVRNRVQESHMYQICVAMNVTAGPIPHIGPRLRRTPQVSSRQ